MTELPVPSEPSLLENQLNEESGRTPSWRSTAEPVRVTVLEVSTVLFAGDVMVAMG